MVKGSEKEQEQRTSVVLAGNALSDDGFWLTQRLEKVTVHFEQTIQGRKYEAWVSLMPTETQEIRVARQLYPGAPPQPADTITLVVVGDQITDMLCMAEDAVLKAANSPKIESGFK
jgi:hypothetical protein